MSNRPLRVCDVCGQVDDHPRHVFGAYGAEFDLPDAALIQAVAKRTDLPDDVVNEAIRSLMDTTELCAHFDCCAQSGRCDGSCAAQIAAAGGNGAQLVQHVESEVARLDAERG